MDERRYQVNGETVRGEPRIYWVETDGKCVSGLTTDRRIAERWLKKFESGELKPRN